MDKVKFRGTLFGGFNRADVSEYIVKLARERNEYKERAETAERLLEQYGAAADAEEDSVTCGDDDECDNIDDCGGDDVLSSHSADADDGDEETPPPSGTPAEDVSRVLGLIEGSRSQLDMAISSLGKIKTDL